MSKSGRIISALALGGMLGMWVALAVSQIIWWLGALAGSLIAGLAYAMPDIVRYAPTAGRTTWHSLTYTPKVVRTTGRIVIGTILTILFLFGLRPKMSINARLMAAIVWVSLISFGTLVHLFMFRLMDESPRDIFQGFVLSMLYAIYALILAMRAVFRPYFTRRGEPGPTDLEILAIRKRTLFHVSPFGVIFWSGWGIGRTMMFLSMVLWELCKFIPKFTKTLVVLVHSKKMVLVSIDTLLGVTATYMLFVRQGELILGVGPTLVLSGFISVLLGYFIDYQIVSRRILHLNGQKI